MIDTVLFDLDDTLLGNDMAHFIPRYFSLLSEYARPLFGDRETFLEDLMAGTQAMIAESGDRRSNREVFWDHFSARTGMDGEKTEKFFDEFYRSHFPQLRNVTQTRKAAREVVQYCFDVGLKVVIATDPLFPRRAVEERLRWAGVPSSQFDFDLITTYENMHATKPTLAYYREILERLGATAERSVMVGNDWERDILPASELGLASFYVVDSGEDAPDAELVVGHGSLSNFYEWLRGNVDGR